MLGIDCIAQAVLAATLFGAPVSGSNTYDGMFESLVRDVGYVASGLIRTEFVFTNSLTQPVHVSRANPTARSSDVVKFDRPWVRPGESLVFEVTVDAQSQRGLTSQQGHGVVVSFDYPVRSSVTLCFRWSVRHDIIFEPPSLAFE